MPRIDKLRNSLAISTLSLGRKRFTKGPEYFLFLCKVFVLEKEI